MPTTANMRRLSIGVVTIIAMVSVLLPVCMAISCGMGSTGMADGPMTGFTTQCASTMTSLAQAAIAPGSQLTLLLTLVAALGMVFVLYSPSLTSRLVRVVAEDPPPPPDDPRGVRLII